MDSLDGQTLTNKMTINISLNQSTLENFRKSFIQLRPKCNEEGNQLVIRHKNTEFKLPRTIQGTNRKGFIK